MKMQMEYGGNSGKATGNNDEEEKHSDGDEDGMPAALATLQLNQNGLTDPYNDSNAKKPKLRPVILVGCKSDLSGERQVDYLDGERTAESFQAPYIECSACTNHRVEDVFELVLIQLFKKEKRERDGQMEEYNKKKMLNSNIIKKNKFNRFEDKSCCTIF